MTFHYINKQNSSFGRFIETTNADKIYYNYKIKKIEQLMLFLSDVVQWIIQLFFDLQTD